MSNVDEETEQLDLAKIHEIVSENEITSKMKAVAETEDTVARPIPAELLNRSQPSTIKMNAIVDISTSLLEEIPAVESNLSETDETREMLQVLGLKKDKDVEREIVFSGTIDLSGRIQLPAEYLTDSRIRPGRKLNIRIEFTD